MKRAAMTVSVLAGLGAFSSATAHPGAKLLTTGKGERTAMTAGMSYADVNGVHLFKGSERLAGDDATPILGAPMKTLRISVSARAPYRSFRSLRTQGFYSGTGPRSRRFTQGFYSGD